MTSQERQLLATAPKHERIAALEPHHAAPGTRVLQHQRVNRRLRDAGLAGASTGFDQIGLAARQFPHRQLEHRVGTEHVSSLKSPMRAEWYKARVTRPGATQANTSGG